MLGLPLNNILQFDLHERVIHIDYLKLKYNKYIHEIRERVKDIVSNFYVSKP